jgi:dolichyl-phosphate beta-glucosyltransferase
MKNKAIKLSVVIPAFNEAANFRKGKLKDLFAYLQKQIFSWEVILVNDGSTDNTLSLLKNLAQNHIRIVDISHGGKVAAVKAGIMAAKGDFVVFTDFDQSTSISEITKVLQKFQHGADVVIARRKHTHDWPIPQRIRSKIFNLLVQLIILPGISDTQCGFKAFRTPLAQKLFKELVITKRTQKGRYMGAFDVELLFLAKKSGYKIDSIDVEWYCVRAGNLAASEPLKMLLDVLSIRAYDLNKGCSNQTNTNY